MSRLLNANFARLWKTKSLWVCILLAAGINFVNVFASYSINPKCVENMGSGFAANCLNIILFAAIFAALFLGTDYANGTIRNKLIVGCTRTQIYLSNLITTAVGGIMLLAAECAATFTAGLILDGKLGMQADEFMLYIAVCLCAVIAVSAIFTVIGMLISSKSTIVTITLATTFSLLMVGIVITSMLAQPEYVTSYEVSADGNIATSVTNPQYVGSGIRDFLTAVNDILPSGQMAQMNMGMVHDPEFMPLYSLGVLAVTTAAGAAVFRRKDLK